MLARRVYFPPRHPAVMCSLVRAPAHGIACPAALPAPARHPNDEKRGARLSGIETGKRERGLDRVSQENVMH